MLLGAKERSIGLPLIVLIGGRLEFGEVKEPFQGLLVHAKANVEISWITVG
jgi:hypothetical protein